ncbi:hypothetical protein [uncultured Dokdonia sp.]|mgnify:FL=1|uniref:hypothetical protein n=1 Tax=uncultured Dokdonia sp. TaxID=575653 RepID=UPI00262AF2E9|nr:hypothetical protein [uncultured Dokdonia sp.]
MLKKLIYLCFVTIMLSSCGDDPFDPCAVIDCGLNGECLDGTCDCEDGYFGVNCEIFDPCFAIDCGDNGTCIDGTCDCEEGYYGDNCELIIKDRFVGTWSGIDCEGDNFELIIQPGATIVTLTIADELFGINANIINENNFYIPEQDFFVPTFEISIKVIGTGKILDNGMLEFDATITVDEEDPETCVSKLEKQ